MKTSYHTDCVIRSQLGILTAEELQLIPSSTRHNWKHRNLSAIFGLESQKITPDKLEMMKKLLTEKRFSKAARALWIVCRTLQQIQVSVQGWQSKLKNHQQTIVKTIQRIRPLIGIKRSLRCFGITYQQFHRWRISREPCHRSFLKICKRRMPNQLLLSEVEIIKSYLQQESYRHWSLLSVYFQALREGKLYCSLGTWYKYAQALGISLPLPRSRRKKHSRGIRARYPGQLLHLDVTIFRPLDQSKVYLYFITDNYSRKILAWYASLQLSAEHCLNNLKNCLEKYGLSQSGKPTLIITDGGPENSARIIREYIEQTGLNLRLLVAQRDITKSNSMAESTNKHMKYHYLYRESIADFAATVRCLEKAVPDHKGKPHGALYGFTPNEVFNGQLPGKGQFNDQIKVARKRRVQENRKINCELCKIES